MTTKPFCPYWKQYLGSNKQNKNSELERFKSVTVVIIISSIQPLG